MTTPVPFIDLVAQHKTIREEVLAEVERTFDAQGFVLGPEVAAFESEVGDYCRAKHAIGCASGTDALILALQALDVGPGDEVITTPFTFFASASSIWRVGATPVFADIDPATFNICPKSVESAITEKTKAVMPVHLFGRCADMAALGGLSEKYGVAVVEDAAQAIGAEDRGRRAGTMGDAGCFSFFPTKNLGGAGDGGLVTSERDDVAERVGRLRVHGDTGGYTHVEVGMNSRLDALQAAVLRVKLRHLDGWTAARQANAARYGELLKSTGLCSTVGGPLVAPTLPEAGRHVFNQYTVRVNDGRRDEILAAVRGQSVGAAVYYPIPLHRQQCFASLGYSAGDLPASEQASAEVMSLPIFSELGEENQDRVITALANACGDVQKVAA